MFSGNGKHKNELNFWVMPNAGFATRQALQKYIDEFEQLHPDIKVKLSIHPWSLAWNKLMDIVKGRDSGPKPDILQVGTTWVATLAHLGALEPVPSQDVLSEEEEQSACIWDPGAPTDSGQDFYCVPWFIDVRVLYYRKDIFDRLQIDPDLLQDWKGFFTTCMEIRSSLKKSGPIPKVIAPLGIPGQKPGVLMHDLAPWIWGGGGNFCSDDLSTATLDQPEAMKGCEFYFDLINQRFMPLPEISIEQPGVSGSFFSGHYAMQLSGAWPIDTFLNPENPLCQQEVVEGFDVTLVPSGPNGRFTFLGGSNLGVSSFSEKKDSAWEFIRFMSDPQRQLDHARSIGAVTARLASFEVLFERFPEKKKVFWDSLGHARRLPRLIELGSVEQIISKMGTRLLKLIRSGEYNHRRLYEEMMASNEGINTVLSLHRYGGKSAGVKS